MGLALTAADIIARLDLKPHPEGGHYRETFRDPSHDANGRAYSTAIYFLLARGERSHWHRIDAVETWHYYAGSPLTLRIADDHGERSILLGSDLAAGENPQAIVPVKAWQTAESNGDWSWWDARSHPVSILQPSNWRRKTGHRAARRVASCSSCLWPRSAHRLRSKPPPARC